MRLQSTNKLLEVPSTPLGETIRYVLLFLFHLLLGERLGCIGSPLNLLRGWRETIVPVSMNSCATCRSASRLSGVSSGPASRNGADIPFSLCQ